MNPDIQKELMLLLDNWYAGRLDDREDKAEYDYMVDMLKDGVGQSSASQAQLWINMIESYYQDRKGYDDVIHRNMLIRAAARLYPGDIKYLKTPDLNDPAPQEPRTVSVEDLDKIYVLLTRFLDQWLKTGSVSPMPGWRQAGSSGSQLSMTDWLLGPAMREANAVSEVAKLHGQPMTDVERERLVEVAHLQHFPLELKDLSPVLDWIVATMRLGDINPELRMEPDKFIDLNFLLLWDLMSRFFESEAFGVAFFNAAHQPESLRKVCDEMWGWSHQLLHSAVILLERQGLRQERGTGTAEDGLEGSTWLDRLAAPLAWALIRFAYFADKPYDLPYLPAALEHPDELARGVSPFVMDSVIVGGRDGAQLPVVYEGDHDFQSLADAIANAPTLIDIPGYFVSKFHFQRGSWALLVAAFPCLNELKMTIYDNQPAYVITARYAFDDEIVALVCKDRIAIRSISRLGFVPLDQYRSVPSRLWWPLAMVQAHSVMQTSSYRSTAVFSFVPEFVHPAMSLKGGPMEMLVSGRVIPRAMMEWSRIWGPNDGVRRLFLIQNSVDNIIAYVTEIDRRHSLPVLQRVLSFARGYSAKTFVFSYIDAFGLAHSDDLFAALQSGPSDALRPVIEKYGLYSQPRYIEMLLANPWNSLWLLALQWQGRKGVMNRVKFALGEDAVALLIESIRKDPVTSLLLDAFILGRPTDEGRIAASKSPFGAWQYAWLVDRAPHPVTFEGVQNEAKDESSRDYDSDVLYMLTPTSEEGWEGASVRDLHDKIDSARRYGGTSANWSHCFANYVLDFYGGPSEEDVLARVLRRQENTQAWRIGTMQLERTPEVVEKVARAIEMSIPHIARLYSAYPWIVEEERIFWALVKNPWMLDQLDADRPKVREILVSRVRNNPSMKRVLLSRERMSAASLFLVAVSEGKISERLARLAVRYVRLEYSSNRFHDIVKDFSKAGDPWARLLMSAGREAVFGNDSIKAFHPHSKHEDCVEGAMDLARDVLAPYYAQTHGLVDSVSLNSLYGILVRERGLVCPELEWIDGYDVTCGNLAVTRPSPCASSRVHVTKLPRRVYMPVMNSSVRNPHIILPGFSRENVSSAYPIFGLTRHPSEKELDKLERIFEDWFDQVNAQGRKDMAARMAVKRAELERSREDHKLFSELTFCFFGASIMDASRHGRTPVVVEINLEDTGCLDAIPWRTKEGNIGWLVPFPYLRGALIPVWAKTAAYVAI